MLVAAAISFYFDEWLDATAILVVIFINGAIGFYMEYQADRSMQALRNLSSIVARVIRDGNLIEINAQDLVPGDKIFAEAGDMVPADARIIRAAQLQANESALTGESVPVEKVNNVLLQETPVSGQTNMLFKGTFVTRGNAHAIVTGTGMNTELGKIASLVSEADQATTPLEKKLESFSKRLIWITILLVAIIFSAGWLMGNDLFQMLRTSIALAVAAIPEGLPIVATLGLARGMLKMAKHKVIVKKLSAVETLGCTTVICTDKTGTLTENKMTVDKIVHSPATPDAAKQRVLQAFILCNTSDIDDQGQDIGDPLETALLKYARDYQSIPELRLAFPKVKEEPFSSETKRMITVHENAGSYLSFAKGAAEEVIDISDKIWNEKETVLTEKQKKDLLLTAEKMASSGSKVIALAFRGDLKRQEIPSSGFTFLALVGLMDPLRSDVVEAVKECRSAGIKIIMITGDHPDTAKQIALQLGIISRPDDSVLLKFYENL